MLFGDTSSIPDPHVLVAPLPDGSVRVAGGASIGLAAGLVLDVYPAGTKRFAPPAVPSGKVSLTTVGPFESAASVVEGGPIGDQSRAALTLLRPPGHRLAVFVEPSASPVLAAARAKLATYDIVDLDATESESQVRLREAGGRFELLGRA